LRLPDITMEKKWYVIHTYAGYENKVKTNLEKRAESMNMEDYIFRIIVPMEDEIQIKDGKRKVVPRKVYPGYVLVEMDLTDTSWYVVRNTPGVTGFVGTGNKPVPLNDYEAETILSQMGIGEQKWRISFDLGENVRVIDGLFEDCTGVVEEVNEAKGRLKVTVSMFGGRDTQIDLDFSQVEKLL